MDEAVVFLCEGGCSVLLMCVVVGGVDVIPQCRSGGGTKDGLQVVGVWLQLVKVATVGWGGEDGLPLAKEARDGLPCFPALSISDSLE